MSLNAADLPLLDQDRQFDQAVKNIAALFRAYSVEDVATSLFVSDLWLPNIASQVKHLLFSAILCSRRPEEFATDSKIKDYADFKRFLEQLYRLSPEFMMLEDYVPEIDWGEIKFPLNLTRAAASTHYRMLYGSSIENSYDHLTLFQILYQPHDGKFRELVRRSPMEDLKHCLVFQDFVISAITSQPNRATLNLEPGAVSMPTEPFWQEARKLCSEFDAAGLLGTDFPETYGVDLGGLSPEVLSAEKFSDMLFDARIIPFLFLRHGGRYYPMLPRRAVEVIFDGWGDQFKKHAEELAQASKLSLELHVGGGLVRFLRERFPKDSFFPLVSARSAQNGPHEIIFAAALKTKNRLVLFYVLPPAIDEDFIEEKLKPLGPKLQEAVRQLQTPPTQLFLHAERQRVEFRSDRSPGPMQPEIVVVVPEIFIGNFGVKADKDFPARIVFMGSLLAVLDEIDDGEMLSDFLDYLEVVEKSAMSPMTSLLDKFSSFRDTHETLIGGAVIPNLVMLDPHWGTHFRHQSLLKFWSQYPERDFFGDPRSWQIREEGPTRIRLVARAYFGSVLHCKIGEAHAFLTAPFDDLSYDQGRTANFLMECVEDNLHQYRDVIRVHKAFDASEEFVVQFFPRSLLSKDKYDHLRHLDPGAQPWRADSGRLDRRAIGIRIVFDEDAVRKAFTDVQDRTMEVALFREIIEQLDSIQPGQDSRSIFETIEKGRSRKPRFKYFTARKPAAFPELTKPWVPESRDFKRAKKRLAELAKQESISEGKYDLVVAKEKLKLLRRAMVAEINARIAEFDFEASIPELLGRADALTHRREYERLTIQNSFEHEVDYDREERYSEREHAYIKMHRNFRYLIEKFVQLEPKGKKELTQQEACQLLAFLDWFFVIADASDAIHYGITPAGLTIDREFLPDVEYGAESKAQQEQYAQEQTRNHLGIVGDPSDALTRSRNTKELMAELDTAFVHDYGFKFTNLVCLLIVLSHWPENKAGAVEQPSYSATKDEIESVAATAITNFDPREVAPMLDFLTLRGADMLRVLGDELIRDDLPVWEHRKRPARYALRPLIKIGDRYLWGPYATQAAGRVWSGNPSWGTLPADIGKKAINEFIEREKRLLDGLVEEKALEIAKRFTRHALLNAELHKLDRAGKHPSDLGDYDVLAYFPDKHIIIAFECKNLLPVFCLKDSKRLREKIFGEPNKNGGHFDQIDRRQAYLEAHWATIVKALRWPLQKTEPPRIITLYITPTAYFWTRFPSRKVKTSFVRLNMLSEYLEKLGA